MHPSVILHGARKTALYSSFFYFFTPFDLLYLGTKSSYFKSPSSINRCFLNRFDQEQCKTVYIEYVSIPYETHFGLLIHVY